jgi:hypothetical protein
MVKAILVFFTIFLLVRFSHSINIGNPVTILGSTPAVRVNQQNGEIIVASIMGGKPVVSWITRAGVKIREPKIASAISGTFVYIWDVDLDKSGNVYILMEKKLADIWLVTYSPGTDKWTRPYLIEDRSSTGGRAYTGNLAVESEGVVHEAHWSQKARGIQGTQYNKITNALTDSPSKNTIWLVNDGSRGEAPDLAYTTKGELFGCHKGNGSAWKPVARKWTGSSFSTTIPSGYSGNHCAEMVSICSDKDGNGHFVFSTGPNGSSDYGLYVATSDAGWASQTLSADIDGGQDGVGPDIAVDYNGTSYVTYLKSGTRLYYKEPGKSWQLYPSSICSARNNSRQHPKLSAYDNFAALAYYDTQGAKIKIISSGSSTTGQRMSLNGTGEYVVGITVYPNPFHTSAEIRLQLPILDFGLPIIYAGVYDINGRFVGAIGRGGVLTKNANDLRTPPLQYQNQNPQSKIQNSFTWNAQDYPAGQYIIKVDVGNNRYSKKVQIIK